MLGYLVEIECTERVEKRSDRTAKEGIRGGYEWVGKIEVENLND